MGKTTLGEMLMLHLMENGHKPVLVDSDINEASQVWKDGERQAFFYDDFLGTNALSDNLGKNEDNRLVRFIDRVQASNRHVLILTTREYILQQANLKYERLERLSTSKVLIDLSSYSTFQKAHILYNHVYFSKLGDAARRSIVRGGLYRRFIEHRNYNPRLIELIISAALASPEDISAKAGFGAFCISSLEDPSKLWTHIIENQLTDDQRAVLFALTTLEHIVLVDDLRTAYNSLRPSTSAVGVDPLIQALRVLEGVFVSIEEAAGGERAVTLRTPGSETTSGITSPRARPWPAGSSSA